MKLSFLIVAGLSFMLSWQPNPPYEGVTRYHVTNGGKEIAVTSDTTTQAFPVERGTFLFQAQAYSPTYTPPFNYSARSEPIWGFWLRQDFPDSIVVRHWFDCNLDCVLDLSDLACRADTLSKDLSLLARFGDLYNQECCEIYVKVE